MLALLAVLPSSAVHAQEDRLEERLSRDSWFQAPATDDRRTRFRQVVETLSSPVFNGRLPGTDGGRRTSDFIAQQFADIGLAMAGDGQDYRQTVRLMTIQSQAKLHYTPIGKASNSSIEPLAHAEYVAWTRLAPAQQSLAGQPVFVGYGVRAPEFDWDDYHGLDVKDRIVVMLSGDPPVTIQGDGNTLDPQRFEGTALTRHGRWDHKLALAAQMGAGAAILVHDTRAAGYPFAAVKNTFGRQRIYLSDDAPPSQEPDVSIWVSQQAFTTMLDGTRITLKALEQMALDPARGRLELPLQISADIESSGQAFESHNVIARLAPTESAPTQAASQRPVVVMAHWDHLGPVTKQQAASAAPAYYPGAADNASGIAQMLDIARKLSTVTERVRPIEFVALTAEESGLLGARHYVQTRVSDASRAVPVAGINIDIANVFGRARDIEVIGLGLSTLDDSLAIVARERQRHISADYAPNIGRLFRSDQYEFIRQGIPSLWIRGGRENRSFLMRGPIEQIRRYLASGYHQQGDSIKPWWNIDSALEDANLIAAFVSHLSNQPGEIKFNPGSPYQQ